MKRKWLLGIVAAGALLALAGCQNGEPQDKESKAEEDSAQETSEETAGESRLISLGEYKGIQVTLMDTEPTEAEIQNEIDATLEGYSELKEVEGRTTIQEGDVANIDYKGLLDGEEFSGGTGSADLEIGSGQFIDGFEEQLKGKEVGGPYSLDLKFPDPYPNNTELSGKPVVFEVTVNKIQEKIIPELTDEFAREKLNCDTAEAYKESVADILREQKEQEAQSKKQYDVMDAIIGNSEFEIADSEVEGLLERVKAGYESYASVYGMDLDTFLQMFLGVTAEEFDTQNVASAEFQIKCDLVVEAVAEKEGITLSGEEYTEGAKEIMASYGYTDLEEFEGAYTKEALEEELLYNKVLEYLAEQAIEN